MLKTPQDKSHRPVRGHPASCGAVRGPHMILANPSGLSRGDRCMGQKKTRKVIRFPLEARVLFWWVASGIVKRGEGRTRDISEKGAFVLASTCPQKGSLLVSSFSFPRSPDRNRNQRWKRKGRYCVLNEPRNPRNSWALRSGLST